MVQGLARWQEENKVKLKVIIGQIVLPKYPALRSVPTFPSWVRDRLAARVIVFRKRKKDPNFCAGRKSFEISASFTHNKYKNLVVCFFLLIYVLKN